MKKFSIPIFFLILLNFCCLAAESRVEVRADAFIPSNKLFREIYGDVNASYGIEASAGLIDCFEGWVNFDWFSKDGRSHVERNESDIEGCGHDSTRAEIANFSFGLRLPYDLCSSFTPYAGIGPSFSRIWIKNKGLCHSKEARWACGGIVKLGVYYDFCNCFFLDVFVDYLYQPVNFKHRHHVDIGGFKTGAGIGYRF